MKKEKSSLVRLHKYTDENGVYLFEKVKFSDGKTFSRIDLGNGEYKWSIKEIRKPLYNLPGVLKAVNEKQVIYITEGEKDADYLINRGLAATTSTASSQWLDEYSNTLKGAAGVIIFPDNDEPGEKIAQKRLRAIRPVIAETKVVNLPAELNGRKIKDVADIDTNGGLKKELHININN